MDRTCVLGAGFGPVKHCPDFFNFVFFIFFSSSFFTTSIVQQHVRLFKSVVRRSVHKRR